MISLRLLASSASHSSPTIFQELFTLGSGGPQSLTCAVCWGPPCPPAPPALLSMGVNGSRHVSLAGVLVCQYIKGLKPMGLE